MKENTKKTLEPLDAEALLQILKMRFEENSNRHKDLDWNPIHKKLLTNPEKLWSLQQMEKTGGEPDVVGHDQTTDDYLFFDCCAESPSGRRSCSFDREGQFSRKEHQPKTNAVDMATTMGITLLTESEYRQLQQFGNFDTKTSSWIQTPENIRKLGGALFADFRYDTVFIYHNGAQSYYAARAFRGALRV